MIIVGYSAYKLDILIHRKSNELTLIHLPEYYPDDESISFEDGFNFAFGLLTQFEDFELDESFGRFHIATEAYGYNQEGEYYSFWSHHEFHKCSKQEIGLDENIESSILYPINENHKETVRNSAHIFNCFDAPERL